jgi:CubicO group peptidase (beta-lactamase class C family)
MRHLLFFILLFQSIGILGQSKDSFTVQDKLNRFLEITDTLREKTNNPGMAMAIFYDHHLILKRTYGLRNKKEQWPVDNKTLFQIGSLTKAFTGVIGFKLEEQGKIDWDEKVVHYLPHFELQDRYAAQNARFQDLFTHKIGVDKHYYWMYGPHLQRDEILKKLKYLSFKGSFRENFLYNNQMYVVAGLVEEKVSGKSWDQLIKENIFEPLDMKNSYTHMSEFESCQNNTVSYSPDGNEIIPNVNIDNYNSAGSITSTIDDMSQWLQLFLNRGVIDKKTILNEDQFQRSIMPLTVRYPDEEVFYGIGWEINTKKRLIFHSGSTAGQRSILCFNPEKGFGLVVLTNQQSNLPNALMNYAANIFLEGSFERIDGLDKFIEDTTKPFDKVKEDYEIKDNAVLKKIKNIEGTYRHPAYGDLTISRQSDYNFNLKYYDFFGAIEYKKADEFTAHLNFFLGAQNLDFTVNFANKKIKSLTVYMPNSQPLEFVKN